MPRPPRKPSYESYIKFSDKELDKDDCASMLFWSHINNANETLLATITTFKENFKDLKIIQSNLIQLADGIEYLAKEIQFNLNQCRHNIHDALELVEEFSQSNRRDSYEETIQLDQFKEGFLFDQYDLGEDNALLEDIENYILNKFKPINVAVWHLYHVLIGAA